MYNNELIGKIVKNVGQEKFDEVILRIYSVVHSGRRISDSHFDERTRSHIILPLLQAGIIEKEKGSLSILSKEIVDSVLERLNLEKIFDIFINKYPVRLLAFVASFLMDNNTYDEYLEEKYLVKGMEKVAKLISAFKQDVEKYHCGFQIFYTTRSSYFIKLVLVPEFVKLLQQKLPPSKIEREVKKLKLVHYIEQYFLNPPISKDWCKKFLDTIEKEGMRDIFEEWSMELESEEILMKCVVLQPDRLKEFLDRKVEEIQEFLIAESRKEELIKEFLETLKQENIELKDEYKVRILSPCDDNDSFSNSISTVYKILHDQLKIKDEYIDAIRCRFHHEKTDRQQEYYEMKFKEFCKSILINYPPANKDEWERLKGKIIEQAIKSLKNR